MVKKQGKVKIRRLWRIKPRTRIKESERIYRRSREKAFLKKLLDGDLI